MGELIYLDVRQKKKEVSVTSEIEEWMNGANLPIALEELYEELYITGNVSSREEYHSLTLPEALALLKNNKNIIRIPLRDQEK